MKPISLHLGFDGGHTDGDPGDGRIRFNSPKTAAARRVYINVRDAQEAQLGDLVPKWGEGDVLILERPSARENRVVMWVLGRVVHGGSYYKVPVTVRTVNGSFAEHDDLTLHHYADAAGHDFEQGSPQPLSVQQPVQAQLPPPLPIQQPTFVVQQVPVQIPVPQYVPQAVPVPMPEFQSPQMAQPIPQSVPPGPPAVDAQQTTLPQNSTATDPAAGLMPPPPQDTAALAAENTQLRELIAKLANDTTELYVVEDRTK